MVLSMNINAKSVIFNIISKTLKLSSQHSLISNTQLIWSLISILKSLFNSNMRGHGGRVVTLSPPTSEALVRSPSRPENNTYDS